ncbi:MAG: fibronectin type III domain-containing protein, partial [candidate division WOR-3 bacterium]
FNLGYISGEITSLVLSPDNSLLYMGGTDIYGTYGGYSRRRLAVVRTDNPSLPTFDLPLRTNDEVYTLSVSFENNLIFIGGRFTSAFSNGERFMGINTTNGQIVKSFPWANHHIYGLTLSPDKKTLYAVGPFTSIGYISRNRIAAIDVETGQITSFNPNADNTVHSLFLSPDGQTLYVGGEFNQIGGQPRNRIAAIDTQTGQVTSFNPDANGIVRTFALSPDGQTLYVGGDFTQIGGQSRNSVAAIDIQTGQVTSFNPGTNGSVRKIVLSSDGSTLYIGGAFTSVFGQPRYSIAAIDVLNYQLLNFNFNAYDTYGAFVFDIALSSDNSTLYIGGSFGNYSPAPLYFAVKFAVFEAIEPQKPTNLTLSDITTSSIKLNWQDNSNIEEGFKIFQSIDGLNFSQISTTTQNMTSSLVFGLSPNNQYWFYVQAFNGKAVSSSDISFGYTLANIPSDIVFVPDVYQIKVSWNTNNNSSSTEYFVQNLTNSENSGWITDDYWYSENLSCGTYYSFSVKARNIENIETDSIENSTSTLLCPISENLIVGSLFKDELIPPPTGFAFKPKNTTNNITFSRFIDLELQGGNATWFQISNKPDFPEDSSSEIMSYSYIYNNWDICLGLSECKEGEYTIYIKLFNIRKTKSEIMSYKVYYYPPTHSKALSYNQTIENKAKIAIPKNFKFSRALKFGMNNQDIKYLQILLNLDPDTKLTDYGYGSPGNETTYFGILTRNAIIRFQEKYKDEILKPLNLNKGTGFVGSYTINRLNKLVEDLMINN